MNDERTIPTFQFFERYPDVKARPGAFVGPAVKQRIVCRKVAA